MECWSFCFFFFFSSRRRHTRLTCDWSSDCALPIYNPENLDARGHLKRGKKLNDGMTIQAPKGYVGGRLRNSWYTTVGTPSEASGREPNKTGAGSIGDLKNIGVGSVCYLTNNLPYSISIEYGHSKQSPAGMARINVTRVAETMK